MSLRADQKTQFICQTCGYVSPKWLGKCPDCGAWNQMLEENRPKSDKRHKRLMASPTSEIQPLAGIAAQTVARTTTGLEEMDRVLGGGIVPGSLVLVGGDPGIGKSTLLMQAAFHLAAQGRRVLYVSGEESDTQIKMRADRIGNVPAELLVYCETRIESVLSASEKSRPEILIVDSIQTLSHDEISSVPGSVSQIRECSAALMAYAKQRGTAVFIVGHVTKGGQLAGPRVLEHMVDTVLYFEGDGQHGYRILRTVKNRFGPTNEVGVFEMAADGLAQVGDPSRLFLTERRAQAAGSAVAVSLEGTRPLLVEIQALTATSYFGMPQRRVSGLDYNRACLMLAVLERRAGLTLGSQDVFLSIAGGLTVTEPALDLAMIVAIASSLKDKPSPSDIAVFGAVGLGGEIRAVTQPEQRCQEAVQLGFKLCIVPERNREKISHIKGLESIGMNSIQEMLEYLFA